MLTEQFRLKPDGFNEIRKVILIRSIPVLILIVAISIGFNYFNARDSGIDIITLLLTLLICIGAMAFGTYRSLNRQKEIFENYIISFTDDHIIREQKHTPTISIPYNEIREIIKLSNGSFTIKGNSIHSIIGIPAQIDNYQALESKLNSIKPISSGNISLFQKYRSLLSTILVLALMGMIFVGTNKILVGISGTLFLVLIGYSAFYIFKSDNVDKRTKRNMWALIIVILSVIFTMYTKLTS